MSSFFIRRPIFAIVISIIIVILGACLSYPCLSPSIRRFRRRRSI